MLLIFFLFVIVLSVYVNTHLYKQVETLRYCYLDMSDAYINKIKELSDGDIDVLMIANETEWSLLLDKHLKEMAKVKLPKFTATEKADYVLKRKH